MAGADELLAGGVVVHGAAGVRAGRVKGDKLAVVEMDQDARITIVGAVIGQGKVDRAIYLHIADLRDHAAWDRAGWRALSRDGRAKRWSDLRAGIARVAARQQMQCFGQPGQDKHGRASAQRAPDEIAPALQTSLLKLPRLVAGCLLPRDPLLARISWL